MHLAQHRPLERQETYVKIKKRTFVLAIDRVYLYPVYTVHKQPDAVTLH